MIKKADKGGATVVMNKEDYIVEANRRLNKKDHYIEIPAPTTKEICKKITAVNNSSELSMMTPRKN